MIEHLLFTELVKKNKVKPDLIIANKIDEIDFPLKHINFIKKDINNLMFHSFNEIVELQKNLSKNETDLYNDFNTEYKIKINISNQEYDITLRKNKKDCQNNIYSNQKNFIDPAILTDDFIDTINKYYILVSLTFGLSLYETNLFIQQNKHKYNLNSRFIIDEIFSFWTNNFKSDFCYFNEKDLGTDTVFEERQIEYCLIQFYYNFFSKEILDISFLSSDQFKIVNSLLKEKTNFKWYVIFGTTILEKIKNEIKNRDESIFDGIKKLKDFNYKMIHKIIDDIINQ
jgi:hypothetical protein